MSETRTSVIARLRAVRQTDLLRETCTTSRPRDLELPPESRVYQSPSETTGGIRRDVDKMMDDDDDIDMSCLQEAQALVSQPTGAPQVRWRTLFSTC